MSTPEKSTGYFSRRILLTGGLLFSGSVATAGCSTESTVSSSQFEPCLAITAINNKLVVPDRYPIGNISYTYDDINYGQVNKPGRIVNDKGEFKLFMPDFPYSSTVVTVSGLEDFNDPNVVVSIDSSLTGEIGFTAGCVLQQRENNIQSAYVVLPTKTGFHS